MAKHYTLTLREQVLIRQALASNVLEFSKVVETDADVKYIRELTKLFHRFAENTKGCLTSNTK